MRSPLVWIALLAAAALGLAAGLMLRGYQSRKAEAHARQVDSLYRARVRDDVIFRREADARDTLRARELAVSDSSRRASDDSLARLRSRIVVSDRQAAARLAAAHTAEEQVAVYQEIYPAAIRDRDNALLQAAEQQRVTARLRALASSDSLEIQRGRARAGLWRATADSLAAVNAELLAHRRPSYLKLGLGAGAAAVTATVVCLTTSIC